MSQHRVIPQRELRNHIGRILREARSGTVFTITVRGRPVARLGPIDAREHPHQEADRERIRRILAMPLDGDDLRRDLDGAEAPIDDPWSDP
jgi:prevent-host-death family protein